MTSSADGDADRHCLAARFADGPHLSAPDIAAQRLANWLGDLEPMRATAIRDLTMRFPFANTILLGIAEASPMPRARSGCSTAIRGRIWLN